MLQHCATYSSSLLLSSSSQLSAVYPSTVAAACCSLVRSSQSDSFTSLGSLSLSHIFLSYPRSSAALRASTGNSSQSSSSYFTIFVDSVCCQMYFLWKKK
eukprot:369419_1